MKGKKAGKPAKPQQRPKQGVLKGMLSDRNRAVEEAAQVYVDQRDERMEAGERELVSKGILIDKMKKAGLSTYKRGGISIALDSVDSVKVRINTDEPEEQDPEPAKEAIA